MDATPAAKRLADLLEKDFDGETGRNWLARELDTAYQAVSRWTTGAARPDPHMRAALQARLGIQERDWWTPEEAEMVKRMEDIGLHEHAQRARARKSAGSKSASSRRSPTGGAEVGR